MHCLVVLSLTVGALAGGDYPIVYSYSSVNTGFEPTTDSTASVTDSRQEDATSYEATTVEPSDEEETTEQPDSSNSKQLLQPRFFAYSDQYQSGQSGLHSNESDDNEKYKFTKGGGQEHTAQQDTLLGHKGDKDYKDYHKYAKGQKGVHDKESQKGKYSDTKGMKKKKKLEGAHFGLHKHTEKGRKGAKYGESGEHNKGHHTKGEHNIHKKDEYVKKHEFYDEYHEGGEHEKNGGFHQLMSKKKGAKKRRGKKKSSEAERKGSAKRQRKKMGHIDRRKGHMKGHQSKGEYLTKGRYLRNNKKRQLWLT